MRSRLCIRRKRLSILGIVLCLLAFTFAFEAKLAWYGPSHSASTQISATKLQPTDTARQVALALAAPSAVQQFSAENPLLLAFVIPIAAVSLARRSIREGRLKVSASPSFSSPQFLRPPPQY
jgi:hypothetical protein